QLSARNITEKRIGRTKHRKSDGIVMAALQRKTGLGKGLGALLQDDLNVSQPTGHKKPENETTASAGSINFIKVDHLMVNPFQPRDNLDETALQEPAESIRVQGMLQPITVRHVGKDQYQLISGERRLRASKSANIVEITAYVRTANDRQ